MSTNHSVGRLTATQEKDHLTATTKKDRSGLCAFTFADGRQCRTPRRSGHPHLCYFHAQKEAERLAAKQAAEDISSLLSTHLLSACDLSAAMARLFCAVAHGQIKPKVASTLAYLSQSMVQSIPMARQEYCEAFSFDSWRRTIHTSFNVPAPFPQPAPQLAPQPDPQPAVVPQPAPQPAAPATALAAQPNPQPIPQPASQPAAPHAPQPAPPPFPNPSNPGQPSSMRPEFFPAASGCLRE